MDAQDTTFAELVDRKAREGGLNDYQLSALIGLLPGRRVFHPKSVQRLRRGERAHLTPELVERIIVALDMDDDEADAAWALAGLLPPGAEVSDVHEMRQRITARRRRRGDRRLPEQRSADLQPASTYFTSPAASAVLSDQDKGATSGYRPFPATSITAESVQPAQLAQVAA